MGGLIEVALGVLACGKRPPEASGLSLLPARTLVVLPEIRDVENLGLIARAAHALGADGILLSDIGCDPFARRVIRVSMGSVFELPIVRSPRLAEDLQQMRELHGMTLIAAVPDHDAQPLHRFVRSAGSHGVAIMFGNEPQGLDRAWVELCNHKLTIPMKPGVDSLNVAVAAGIVLHYFTCLTST